jgi:hypothetical protein
MALTVSIVEKFVVGSRQGVVADVTFDSSYATGGEAVTASMFGLRSTISSFPAGLARNASTGAVGVRYDAANAKLQAFSGATEVASTTDLSAYVARVFVIGK